MVANGDMVFRIFLRRRTKVFADPRRPVAKHMFYDTLHQRQKVQKPATGSNGGWGHDCVFYPALEYVNEAFGHLVERIKQLAG